jgi:phosphohistidine phosphatase
MTRRLTLLRHAKSSWDDAHLADHERPLNARGREAVKTLRRHLEQRQSLPDLVLCSSAVRTVATLDGIRGALPATTSVEVEQGLYGAGENELLERVRGVPDDVGGVMLIGHNPGIEDLALLLIGDGDAAARAAMAAKFPTGAMAVLRTDGSWRDVGPGAAYLEEFWTPR